MNHVTLVSLTVSIVTVFHVTTENRKVAATTVRIKVMNVSTGSQLEVIQVSSAAGYIQTPGFSYQSLHPKKMDSVVRVEVPKNHTTLITVLHLNLTGKRHRCVLSNVSLEVYETNRNDMIWHCPENFNIPLNRSHFAARHLSHSTEINVHFMSRKSHKTGFKLYFSVHDKSSFLPGGSDDVWNCTVPNFADFQPHFPCDLYPQCIDKQDERHCPYFSEECGLGFISLGKFCLFYENKVSPGSWRDMEFGCRERGGRMANFRTRADYDLFLSYLQPGLIDVWEFYRIVIGLHSSSLSLPMMYRQEFQHSDETIAFYRLTDRAFSGRVVCGAVQLFDMDKTSLKYVGIVSCARKFYGEASKFICEIPTKSVAKGGPLLPTPLTAVGHPPLVRCPLRHVTRDFLACDLDSTCWSRGVNSCPAPLTPLPPSFACVSGVHSVCYTLVCDFRPDCSDGSDESFCVFPPCDLPGLFHCSDHECLPWSTVCDGQRNCYNGVDEDLCSETLRDDANRPSAPAIIQLNRQGKFTVHRLNQSRLADLSSAVCPETHFHCSDGYCMPVFLRCNGVYDCLDWEDEAGCNTYTCPGFYRCRGSRVCLHPDHLCDDVFQCPQNDDELLCDSTCPEQCTCYGLAFYCQQVFQASNFTKLRFLDGRGSGIRVEELAENVMLIHLSLVENGLTLLGKLNFPNLRSLDLRDNQLKEIQLKELSLVPQLESLSLSGNPLLSLFQNVDSRVPLGTTHTPLSPLSVSVFPREPVGLNVTLHPTSTHGEIHFPSYPEHSSERVPATPPDVMHSLHALDLSRVKVQVLNPSFLSLMPNLHILNMSGGGVDALLGEGFQALTRLRALDLRGCPLTYFPRDLLQGLQQLETVHSDNFKLCCPATLPAGFRLKNCHAPCDEISSCEALLRSNMYRVFLSLFTVLSLCGNAGSFVYRLFIQNRKQLLGFDVFVAHLCIADFSMGAYLSLIGVADLMYRGTYLWEDNSWKESAACKVAGFLCLLSSEVSALVICLITIDRFLVLRFPFSTFHFGTRTALLGSLCVWGLGCMLAAVPLAPGVDHWQFYSQTGICIPLPISRADSPGYAYSFGVMIVANFIFFVVIAVGQVFIYWSVHTNTVSSSETTRKIKDVTIARRLITVAMSDFLCWFPIGLSGILAATGTPISGEISVAMIIFVLPFNSALNPFLYTLNIVLEKRRKAAEGRIKNRLLAQFRSVRSEDKAVNF